MMRIICLIACLLLCGMARAEMIGNVKYHLPSSEQGWELVNHISDNIEKSSTLIYVSENELNREDAVVFAAHSNPYPFEGTDQISIEQAIQSVFPGQKCDIKILEKTENSILFEWTNDNFYCLSRAFSINNGTVMLQIMTENPRLFLREHARWVSVLKEAKQV